MKFSQSLQSHINKDKNTLLACSYYLLWLCVSRWKSASLDIFVKKLNSCNWAKENKTQSDKSRTETIRLRINITDTNFG